VHINEFQGFLNQLSLMNLELVNEMQALILLSSLPDSWETLVVSISNSTLNGKITLKKVKDSILNEEKRRKGTNTFESHALVKIEGEVKVGSLMVSKIENPTIEKENESQEEDLSQGRELSVLIMTSQGILKKIVERIKEIKRIKTKIRMKIMVQLQLYLMVMLPLFVTTVVLILYVRIHLGGKFNSFLPCYTPT